MEYLRKVHARPLVLGAENDGLFMCRLGLPCIQVFEEESHPLLCGFTAMLFGYMPLAYEDSVKVKLV